MSRSEHTQIPVRGHSNSNGATLSVRTGTISIAASKHGYETRGSQFALLNHTVLNFSLMPASSDGRAGDDSALCKAVQTSAAIPATMIEKTQEVSMTAVRILAIASLGVVLGSAPVFAQSLSHYREYTLESSLASVMKTSGAGNADVKTVHERPAIIRELEWRAPYVSPGTAGADPIRGILFRFYDDQLYRVVVTYDSDRMEGLTNADVIEVVAGAYGAQPIPSRASDSASLDLPVDTTVIARWDDGVSVLGLVRGGYSREFQLVLISKQLSGRARAATKEALRLDAVEAPQRELGQRNKVLADARVAQEKARAVNKVGFKP